MEQVEERTVTTNPLRRQAVGQTLRCADVLVDILAEGGVREIFGIPGGPIAPLNDALLTRPGIRVTTTTHENSAVFAAAGYARMSGGLGVALVTSGPGVLNALTGLASAHCDGVPVLLLVGEVARPLQGKQPLQDGSAHHLNILGMARSITKLALEVPDKQAAPAILMRAMATALSGRRGPVLLTLPMDILAGTLTPPAIALCPESRLHIPDWALERAATTLSRTSRGVIFAGSGCRHGEGPAKLLALAEHLDMPVMTTPKAKGVFPETHRLSLGVFGMGGHPSSVQYLSDGVDTILVLGSSLGDLATDGWSKLLKAERAFVQVDIDAINMGRNYPANLAIVTSIVEFIDRVLPVLPAREGRGQYGPVYHTQPQEVRGHKDSIAPQRALWELQEILADDTIYAVDSGEHYFFATHYLRLSKPDAYLIMTGLGSMGSSIGGAIGAQMAQPHRSVAVICGDGGFVMSGNEIATAVALKLPIVYFVFNDQRLGMVELGHKALYGRSPDFSTPPVDVVQMTRALGAEAFRVRAPNELLALEMILTDRTDKPIVIDVHIDRSIKMPRSGRFESLGNASRGQRPE